MQVLTTRFGEISAEPQDRIDFPAGLIGMSQMRRFVRVADPEAAGLVWLQSMQQPAWALALVPPRRFQPDYQVRAAIEQLQAIEAVNARDVEIFAILGQRGGMATVNLQAPILINRSRGLGMQFVLEGTSYSVRQPILTLAELRKTA